MANYRAQVVFQGVTGIPEDRFINTFHFVGLDGDHATNAGRISLRLAQVWQVNLVTPTAPLGDYYSPFCEPTVEVRVYDLADAEPRIPVINTFTIAPGTLAGGVAIPEEVAVTLSFRGAPPHTPRRRGRVFLGPLTSNFLTAPGTTGPVRVTAVFRTLVAERADALKDLNGTDMLSWVIRSITPAENFVEVTDGWVDDAPDTIRRRGPVTTTRTLW